MWLPDPIYKPAPYYWMLLGVLFVALGTYRASEGDLAGGLICLGAGLASCFWSLRVALRRGPQKESSEDDADLDQTCELYYKPE